MPGKRRQPKHPIDRGAPASVVADKFGGGNALAKAIGKSPSTVHRWIVNGHIDGRYQPEINSAAKRLNVKLKPIDYVDTRAAPAAAPHGQAVA